MRNDGSLERTINVDEPLASSTSPPLKSVAVLKMVISYNTRRTYPLRARAGCPALHLGHNEELKVGDSILEERGERE
jgi:hypothetical protein